MCALYRKGIIGWEIVGIAALSLASHAFAKMFADVFMELIFS